ncbi:MAG: hypothetical protein AAGC60_17365 [Acidobacteriota bacterium]
MLERDTSWWVASRSMLMVDLFVENPIPFEDAWARSETLDLDGTEIRYANLEHLMTMKRAAGRSKDLDDVEKLARIQRTDRS